MKWSLTSLNGIYRCVGKWTHGPGNKTDSHMLIRWQIYKVGLKSMRLFFQLLICCEICACLEQVYQFQNCDQRCSVDEP